MMLNPNPRTPCGKAFPGIGSAIIFEGLPQQDQSVIPTQTTGHYKHSALHTRLKMADVKTRKSSKKHHQVVTEFRVHQGGRRGGGCKKVESEALSPGISAHYARHHTS